jgi:hypothetical protein
MLFFVLTVAAGIVALLAAQKLDIEGVNPPAPRRSRPKNVFANRKADTRGAAPATFAPGAVFLRQQ